MSDADNPRLVAFALFGDKPSISAVRLFGSKKDLADFRVDMFNWLVTRGLRHVPFNVYAAFPVTLEMIDPAAESVEFLTRQIERTVSGLYRLNVPNRPDPLFALGLDARIARAFEAFLEGPEHYGEPF